MYGRVFEALDPFILSALAPSCSFAGREYMAARPALKRQPNLLPHHSIGGATSQPGGRAGGRGRQAHSEPTGSVTIFKIRGSCTGAPGTAVVVVMGDALDDAGDGGVGD